MAQNNDHTPHYVLDDIEDLGIDLFGGAAIVVIGVLFLAGLGLVALEVLQNLSLDGLWS